MNDRERELRKAHYFALHEYAIELAACVSLVKEYKDIAYARKRQQAA